jgi:hypothetical protein
MGERMQCKLLLRDMDKRHSYIPWSWLIWGFPLTELKDAYSIGKAHFKMSLLACFQRVQALRSAC